MDHFIKNVSRTSNGKFNMGNPYIAGEKWIFGIKKCYFYIFLYKNCDIYNFYLEQFLVFNKYQF